MSGMEWGPKRAFADPETTSMVAFAVVVLVATYGAKGWLGETLKCVIARG